MKFRILFIFFFLQLTVQAQVISIPFQSLNNRYVLIKLPVANCKDSLTFFFDTGATATLIDKTFAEKNQLKPNASEDVTGAGGKQNYETVQNQTVILNEQHQIENIPFIIKDLSSLNQNLGEKFDGIIGYDLLKRYTSFINIEQKRIELYNSIQDIDVSDYELIPIEFKNNIPIPQFPITIELNDGSSFTQVIFFDSGAIGVNLLMNSNFDQQHEIRSKLSQMEKSSSSHLNGTSTDITSVIKSLKIGSHLFSQVPFRISEDKQGVNAFPNYMGILGSGIINQFNFIVDYTNMKLYIKPNRNYSTAF